MDPTPERPVPWLAGRPMQLTQPGLLPRRERPLGLGAVLPEDQLRWILRRAHARGLTLPDYDRQLVLETLARVDLVPAPWHRVMGDRLVSAGLVLHASWRPRGGRAVSVLGTNGLWTVHLDLDHQGEASDWAGEFLAQAYDGLLAAAPPARGCGVSAVVPGHEWALRRVWPNLEQRTGQSVEFAPYRPVPGVPSDLIIRFFSDELLDEFQQLALPRQEGVPLAQCDARWLAFADRERVRQLLPELAGGRPPLGLTNAEVVLRRCLARSVHDWYSDEGRPDMTDEIKARQTELRSQNNNARPVRCAGGPGVCDDCRWTPECRLPALCYQEAWAVALVAAMPLDQNPALHSIPPAEVVFEALLQRVKDHDGLTDLAGLRFRHVPSRVAPTGRADAAASLGWASGAGAWGPVLGDHVMVHEPFRDHGKARARCYTVLTAGGMVTLIVRVAHAARWAEEARQLGWDEERRRAFGLVPFAGGRVETSDGAHDRAAWGPRNYSVLPCKMHWWPAGHMVGEETLQCDCRPWKWEGRPAFSLLPYRPDEPVQSSCPAALVYTWSPRPGTPHARTLAALALRQQNFLHLCARVRAEAGLAPAGRADPAACFYGGCRGANPRVPVGCVPAHRWNLPGQTFSGHGSLMTLPGLASDGLRALPGDPGMPKDMTRRLGVYQTAAGHVRAGRLPTVRQLAAETGVRNLLFLRAVLSELGLGTARLGDPLPPEPVAMLEHVDRPFEQYESRYAEMSFANDRMAVARPRPSPDVRCDALRQAAEEAARAAAEWAAAMPVRVAPPSPDSSPDSPPDSSPDSPSSQ